MEPDKQNIILECADIKDKCVLEVGPGTGNLTYEILRKKPKELILIEKDTFLLDLLKIFYAHFLFHRQ